MAEPKKIKYEVETTLPAKLIPAPYPTTRPSRREEGAAQINPGVLKKPKNKELILKIIDFIESL